jgi:hypothetical protein
MVDVRGAFLRDGHSLRRLARSGATRPAWRGAATALAALALAGCGALPPRAEVALSTASRPSPESPLVRIAQASIPAPELSGFR